MAPPSDISGDFRAGTVRGAAGGFRVAQAADGRWWFIDPDGRPFFLRAVNGVEAAEGSPHDPVARLRAWGFNTLGPGAEPALREEGLAFVGTVDFAAAAPAIRTGGARLPDVFDPAWPEAAALHAGEVCLPWCERHELVGWLADAGLGWAQAPGRPTLLQLCLSLEPQFAAYHAAWEFTLAAHSGRIENLARAWGVMLANKEAVRALTREEKGIATRGYARDDARWAAEFARRFYAVAAAAVRAHDPRHLLLGGSGAPPALLAASVRPSVDVLWIRVEDLGAAQAGPVVAGDFTWVGAKFFANTARTRALTTVERMLRRGRLALQRLAAQPGVAGYAWAQWRDGAAEQPPFAGGLVHANDTEAREHTELVAACNERLSVLHQALVPAPPPTP